MSPSLTTDSLPEDTTKGLTTPKNCGKTPLQAICQGESLPPIPSFTSIELHRHWLLTHMAGAFRVFARRGYTEGMAGHISVRDPENPHTFWTNPLGRHFGLLKASDMLLVNEAGEAVGGNLSRPANVAGFQIHSAIHRARPDVNAACHTHSKYGKAWSTFGRPLEMLNQDICLLHGKYQAVYPAFNGIVFSEEEGRNLAAALGPEGKAMILQNHGLLTVGKTVDEAAYLYTLMERSCEVQLLVEAAGLEKKIVEGGLAEETARLGADAESLYYEFQPDLEWEMEATKGDFAN